MEGDRSDGCHRCRRGTREGGRMGIGGVVHRHNAVHGIGPDRMLNLSMCINGIPAKEVREREREGGGGGEGEEEGRRGGGEKGQSGIR